MKGTSKFIMGATLVMVVSLAIVLGLILVLLAELYCSLLLRRRQLRKKTNTIPISTTQTTITISNHASSPSHTPQHSPSPPPFNNNAFYLQGVLQAPRSILFPCKDEANATPRGIGLVSKVSSSPSLASFLARAPPHSLLQQQNTLQVSASGINEIPCADYNNKSCGGGVEHLVYISNPIYENEEGKASGANDTPFETPHTSPSRLERSGSSEEDDDHAGAQGSSLPPSVTPPLTPMKNLPAAEGSSVSLRDAASLGTSGSDSHSINGPSSSSSLDTPCTSPTW